jgi:hypothetical protein
MGHWLADLHLAGFAPAFTLSFQNSECSRKAPRWRKFITCVAMQKQKIHFFCSTEHKSDYKSARIKRVKYLTPQFISI